MFTYITEFRDFICEILNVYVEDDNINYIQKKVMKGNRCYCYCFSTEDRVKGHDIVGRIPHKIPSSVFTKMHSLRN